MCVCKREKDREREQDRQRWRKTWRHRHRVKERGRERDGLKMGVLPTRVPFPPATGIKQTLQFTLGSSLSGTKSHTEHPRPPMAGNEHDKQARSLPAGEDGKARITLCGTNALIRGTPGGMGHCLSGEGGDK